MSGQDWRCNWCGETHDGAKGICDCGTVRGRKVPGDADHTFLAMKHKKNEPPPDMADRLSRRLGIAGDTTGAGNVSNSGAFTADPPTPTRAPLEPILIVSDAHIPFESPVWWDLLMQVAKDLKPKHLVIIGDFCDFYAVSSHDKNPVRANMFLEELDAACAKLDELDALGATDKIYIEGNHEDRLGRYLMKNPALSRVVSTERLLNLKERGWEFVPYKDHIARGAVHYTHDVGSSGRNAVYALLATYQHSVVAGHTHRLQYVVEGSALGECKLAATFGWGGNVDDVDYMCRAKARKDWALGFGHGYIDPESGFTYLTPTPIVEGTCVVSGKLYRSALYVERAA